jgi:glucose/arabinose dehydrogenase
MHNSTRLTLAALLSLALAPCLALAQGDKPAKAEPEAQPAPTESKAAKPQPQPYLLKVSVSESDAGKPSATKNYTLTVLADDNHSNGYESLRDGDRIPFNTEKGQNYHDLGTNLDLSNPTRQGETLIVKLSVSGNSLVNSISLTRPPDQGLPAEHDWRIQVVAVLPSGKPTLVYSATDAVTGHKVEIQATAQPIVLK